MKRREVCASSSIVIWGERERKSKQTHIIHICKQNYEDLRWIGGFGPWIALFNSNQNSKIILFTPFLSFSTTTTYIPFMTWRKHILTKSNFKNIEKKSKSISRLFYLPLLLWRFILHSLHHCSLSLSRINMCPKNIFSYFLPSWLRYTSYKNKNTLCTCCYVLMKGKTCN